MKKEFVIVIPIYNKEPNPVEIISLNRINAVLKNSGYDIVLIYPASSYMNNLDNYDRFFSNFKKHIFKLPFHRKYFESITSYSQLLISKMFYKKFISYEYLYILQTDCYLFRDDFRYWYEYAKKNDIDYIGAPIISKMSGWDSIIKTGNPVIGNGGFSIRKVKTFLNICDKEGEFRTTYPEIDFDNVIYEDKFFCNDIKEYYDLRTPDFKTGLEFSWDMSVEYIWKFIYKKDTSILPTCAHAIDKNIMFWKCIIPELNNDVIEFCKNKFKNNDINF